MVRYLSRLTRGERSSQRGYNDWARNQDGAPWANKFNRQGGFDAVRASARERMRATR
jgi:hypothetical protein